MRSEAPLVIIFGAIWLAVSIGVCAMIFKKNINALKLLLPDWPSNGAVLFIGAVGFGGYRASQLASLKSAFGEKGFSIFTEQRHRCIVQVAISEIVLFACFFGLLLPLLRKFFYI